VECLEDRLVPTVQAFPVVNGVLMVNGDQIFLPTNDNIAVATTPTGGVSVTMNNETVTFDPGQVNAIVINPGGSFNGNNFIDIQATNVPVTIHDTDPRGDIVHIGQNASLQGIRAPVTLQNDSPWTALTVDDVADRYYRLINISATAVHVSGIADIALGGGDPLYQLTVAAGGPRAATLGDGGNLIGISSIANTLPVPARPRPPGTPMPPFQTSSTIVTIDTGFGNNAVVAGPNLDAFRGWLSVNGQGLSNYFYIDDSANLGAHNYDLEFGSFSRSGMPNFWTFQGIDHLYVTGAAGADTFTIGSVPWNALTFISGGISNANTLAGPMGTVDWSISGPYSGSLAWNSVHFDNIQNLRGNTGVDTFQFAVGGIVNSIDGGGGGGWLDYSTYGKLAVSVNLTTGQATGVLTSIANIQNVLGNNGNDVLVGGAGGNILIGGGGSNTLVGGPDGNLLIGGFGQGNTLTAGTFGDILIGGWTEYDPSTDANRAALQSILNEWRFDVPWLRIPRLTTGNFLGQGLNGNNLLNGITVYDNPAADTLNAGPGIDWFFIRAAADIVNGAKMNDRFYYY
jgi:hypothetical protein